MIPTVQIPYFSYFLNLSKAHNTDDFNLLFPYIHPDIYQENSSYEPESESYNPELHKRPESPEILSLSEPDPPSIKIEPELPLNIFPPSTIKTESSEIKPNSESNSIISQGAGKKHAGRKANFSAEDKAKLIALVKQYGEAQWSLIATKMPGWNRKQLRDHYVNFIKGKSTSQDFTPSEDSLILSYVNKYGHVWKKIADLMPSRSAIAIKNRYYKKLEKVSKQQVRKTYKTAPPNYAVPQDILMTEEEKVSLYTPKNSVGASNSIKTDEKSQIVRLKVKTREEQIQALLEQKVELEKALNIIEGNIVKLGVNSPKII